VVRGTEAESPVITVGPDLTHFGSRLTIGAGTLEQTTENLLRWVTDAQEIKPGNAMPSHTHVDRQALEQIVAWLEELR
jgi:cytochrome c oxidase subunit II